MKKTFYSLAAILVALTLTGAGCSDLSDLPVLPSDSACFAETPWNSCIDQYGVDDALLGSWRLSSQTVSTPAGSVVNPFSGRMLTFYTGTIDVGDDDIGYLDMVDRGYLEDYSTESSGDCQASGTSGGSWTADADADLDAEDINPDEPVPVLYQLEIVVDASNPTVECQTNGGAVIRANTASSPLGVGPGGQYSGGMMQMTYDYTISNDHSMLTITKSAGGITNTFVFTR